MIIFLTVKNVSLCQTTIAPVYYFPPARHVEQDEKKIPVSSSFKKKQKSFKPPGKLKKKKSILDIDVTLTRIIRPVCLGGCVHIFFFLFYLFAPPRVYLPVLPVAIITGLFRVLA